MKEPIAVSLTGREALALLNAALVVRHDLKNSRPELATAESKIADAIAKASEAK